MAETGRYERIAVDTTWHNIGKVHDWRDCVTDTVRGMWGTFSDAQKKAIQEMAQEMADKEEWD